MPKQQFFIDVNLRAKMEEARSSEFFDYMATDSESCWAHEAILRGLNTDLFTPVPKPALSHIMAACQCVYSVNVRLASQIEAPTTLKANPKSTPRPRKFGAIPPSRVDFESMR